MTASMRILLIEDDQQQVADVTGFLEKLGHTVLLATSAAAGFRTMRSEDNDLDLIILDMQMPHQDGGTIAIDAGLHFLRYHQDDYVHIPVLLNSSEVKVRHRGKKQEIEDVIASFQNVTFREKIFGVYEPTHIREYLDELQTNFPVC